MTITVTEALRLKNEISNIVKQLQYKINQSSFGDNYEDDTLVSTDVENKFIDTETSLIKALTYSTNINNTLSSYNRSNGVDGMVRDMQNEKLLLSIYQGNLDKCKPNKRKRFETVGNTRVSIETEYKPTITSSVMKDKISQCKNKIRVFQTDIEKLNQGSIELNFGFSDLENISN